VQGAADVPLFEGLGSHTRPVTTRVPGAQRYFDQGLALLYGFNHDEAIRAFEKAAELDPKCAMAYWGIAYAKGPHINNPVLPPEREQEAFDATAMARERAEHGSEVEKSLIDALGVRYASPQVPERGPLDQAFAAAMGKVAAAHPDDADVGALYAESLMDLHPWDLWLHDGTPQPWTPAIVAQIEQVLAKAPKHPLALHLYIHAVEASPEPGMADVAADALRDLMPALGHMVHMPSHIDVRRGRWEQAILANTKAMQADEAYRARNPKQDFYRIYMAHNHHMRAFAAMMVGKSELALASVRTMVSEMPEDWLKNYVLLADGWVAMPLEVLMRFGRWEEILAEPEPADYLPFSRALRHYARGVAYAAIGKVDDARAEQRAFLEQRVQVSPEATFGNNKSQALLDVAEKVLEGEILFRAGRIDEGLAALREGVVREDALTYSEPPDWIQPVRHPLGASLLQAGRHDEAEAVFHEDLENLPGNGWALFGMGRALRLQGKDAEAALFESRFAEAWEGSDVKITSPCFCQKGV
jgi:tetratricopeptide (TPR) repeat protein